MNSLNTFKEEQKKSATELRELKAKIKNTQKAGDYAGTEQYTLQRDQREYRHRHIAYSMLRGKKYEQIERTCRVGNEPDFDLIKRIQEDYAEQEASEHVCACA